MLVGIVGALVGLAVLGGFLNYYYRGERSKRAAAYFQTGQQLELNQRYGEAVEQYRSALSISHSLADRLALGLALIKAGRPAEAAIYLNGVLREDPENGPAHLGLAQIDAGEGRAEDAIRHFQRAVLGTWIEDPVRNRLRAQMNFVEYLDKTGRRTQAQAELLSLLANRPTDAAVQKQIAEMLLKEGMAREAANMFQGIIGHGPATAGDFNGLGDAEFAMGDYDRAVEAYRSALRIDPADQAAATRADLSEKIIALDPVLRGLGAEERYRRSRELLSRVLNGISACAGSPAALNAGPAAQATLAGGRRPPSYSDAADQNIFLAEQLWTEGSKTCGQPRPDDPVPYLMGALLRRQG
jgi:tetratricopeptide (TPR) repeat protein